MGVVHVGLVHRDPCRCKVKGFRAVSSIERNVSKRRHLQGMQHSLRHPAIRCLYICTIQSWLQMLQGCLDSMSQRQRGKQVGACNVDV